MSKRENILVGMALGALWAIAVVALATLVPSTLFVPLNVALIVGLLPGGLGVREPTGVPELNRSHGTLLVHRLTELSQPRQDLIAQPDLITKGPTLGRHRAVRQGGHANTHRPQKPHPGSLLSTAIRQLLTKHPQT